jgi:protein Tex
MTEPQISYISNQLNIPFKGVLNTIKLFEDGATIPFISRYRKELTGSLNEVQIEQIAELEQKIKELDKRRISILETIKQQGKLTDALKLQIEQCNDKNELEDLYLPYKVKRNTRAETARINGLEPLAIKIYHESPERIEDAAKKHLNDTVLSIEDALKGAKDIVAEWISENQKVRAYLRKQFMHTGVLSSTVIKGKDTEGIKYQDYFDFTVAIKKCSSHRFLAVMRGEKEGILKVQLEIDDQQACDHFTQLFVKNHHKTSQLLQEAIVDGYKRLLKPSIITEVISVFKETSDEIAIQVFSENLRQLLLSAPLGQKKVLAIDPGFRTGCKVVCLDQNGQLMHNETIYPHAPQKEVSQSMKKISNLVESYDIQAIAIGNGTASRETEQFIQQMRFPKNIQVFVVSENGASIYSASKVAREEFPEYDVTVRGSVSIGRRLMDPLAELVKIDPKSIGVGQYQHDVDQSKLKKMLDNTVVSCVNQVGINVNTASKYLLTYVSGLSETIAKNIVEHRNANGSFKSRKELLQVPRLGAKAYEQAAGFLRIKSPENPLDNTAVHPERYELVEKMAKDMNCTILELIQSAEIRSKIQLERYCSKEIGLPTLKDILSELEKPGLDPRSKIEVFSFNPNIKTIQDLTMGMVLPGIVTNLTAFGCFVDFGIKENGLVHISQLADHFVSDPNQVVSLHQHVQVKIIGIDLERKRIQLSMKSLEQSENT